MTPELDVNPPVDPAELIAYLDGEVDAQTSENIERCLAEDPQLARRMRQHQQAWDFLDALPREEVSGTFTQATLQMVAVAAAGDEEARAVQAQTLRRWLQVAAGVGLMAASLAGFWLASTWLARPNRGLLEDLPVIENLDAYQQVENVEFLRALENEGLFVAEVDDER